MKYIILHEHDSGNPHGVNLKYLQDWFEVIWHLVGMFAVHSFDILTKLVL